MSTSSPTDRLRVVLVDVPATIAGALLDRADVEGTSVATDDGLEGALEPPPHAVVVGGTPTVAIAQRAHRSAPSASVLLLAPSPAALEDLTGVLRITPGIGRHTRCFDASDPVAAVAEVVEELGWSAQRHRHHDTITELRSSLTHLVATPLETMSRYLGQLFDHAPVGILLADDHGVIRAANPRTSALTGRHPQETVGTTFATLFSGDAALLARDLLVDCISSGSPAMQTLTRTGPDGTTQHLEVTVAAVDPDLESLGVIILLHDESARIRALEAADHARRQAERAAKRFAELARTLQRSLLPPDLPEIEGFDLAARYHAAGDGTLVGGDFYDMLCLPDGRWCVLLGDVSGKGVDAAALTSLARYSLRTAALRTSSASELFATLNAVLREYASGERFCTLAAILVDGAGAIEVAIAGHPAPIVLRLDGSLEPLGVAAPPLGLFEQIDVETVSARLDPGDSIVVTSDGVTEARSPSGEFADDLLDLVLPPMAGLGATVIADAVDAAVLAVERARTRDDVAIVVLSRLREEG